MPRRQSIISCKLIILGLLLSFVTSKLSASSVLLQCMSKQPYLSQRKQHWLQTAVLFPWSWPSKPSLILMETLTARVTLPWHSLCIFNLHKKSSERCFYRMCPPLQLYLQVRGKNVRQGDALVSNHPRETQRREYTGLLPPTFNELCLSRRTY